MNKIKEAYKDIKPSEDEKKEILKNILKENKETEKVEKKKINFKIVVPTALAAMVAFGLFAGPAVRNAHSDVTLPSQEVTADAPSPMPPQLPPPASSPVPGMRKFLNYNNFRYEFLDNGKLFSEKDFALGEKLGTIEKDITANPSENGKLNLASSFSFGSDIYSLKNYDPDFRIAVKQEDGIYICQNVDNTDGSDVDIKEFLDKADFSSLTESIDVYDHFEREVLNTFDKERSLEFIEELKMCKNISLSNEDYEKIAGSQTEGKSFKICLILNDGTDYKLYVIPSLNIAMIGDNKYRLPNSFNESFYKDFEGLKQGPAIMN